ncbi:hypothetical protein [Paenibacillus spongiae]|uniref:Uncharacterized protein n=1 Tax=Paenibacillus spongiae TaxID=2909671 RepID=A0ABY5SET3_9BACL|nr:hypothetical protein [Paenibacillus spongiae]UVI31188.1 hypothetical protein L1F29_04920 [Paenibacillus spongiae]
MGFLQPFSKTDGRTVGFGITADKMKRVCLSASLMRELGVQDKTDLYLYWDSEYRRIGISKTCTDKNVVPFSFDNRGYTPAKDFIKYCEIDTSEKAVNFYYEGMEGDIYIFGQTGRRIQSFKQQRNGDLERLG